MKKIITTIVLFFAVAITAMADFTYSREMYEKAILGDVESMYQLSVCYMNGTGVAADYDRSDYWLERAAHEGQPNAMAALRAMLGKTGLKDAKRRELAAEEKRERERLENIKKQEDEVIVLSASSFIKNDLCYEIIGNGASVKIINNDVHKKLKGDIAIPSSVTYKGKNYMVTTIGGEAFKYCRGLTSVTIPGSVTEIGEWAFNNCSGLTSVTIPNSVTTIGDYVFFACSGLTSVTIPNSVTTIGNNVFFKCTSLTSVTIPNFVTTIGDYAFSHCEGLTSVTIPNSVTTIGDYAFEYCSGLTSVTIPNSVTTIGDYAFSDCSGLTSVTIPNSVTTIGNRAFNWCTGLAFVTIPGSVTTIGSYVFYNCSGLSSIHCQINNPNNIRCDEYAFEDIDKKKCTLYVPKDYVKLYKKNKVWRDFVNIKME